MKKNLFVILTLITIGCNSFAQKFTASVTKNKVKVGEPFQVSFTLNTNGVNFKPPSFNDFDIYSGPNQSTSMQYINGNMSQSLTLSYVLAAKKEGKLTVGNASIVVDGKKIESDPVIIEAVKGSPGQTSQGNSQNQDQGTTARGEDLFARTVVNKLKVYQGEQITLTHKIYTKLNLRGFQDIKFPDYNGFWSQELQQQSQITLTQENFEGVAYNVAEMRKVFLFPQRTGTIEIEPMEIKCIVRQRSNRGTQSIFDQFFGGGGYEDIIVTAKSKPVKIEIVPLPENGKPANFSGAVGNFSFKAQIAKEKVKTNDAINLNLTISGRGNLKLLDPIKINFPEEFETYDPKIIDNTTVSTSGVTGSKNFEYLVIPRKEGTYTLEPINFSYFDPEKKTYITLPSPEFSFTVEKGENNDSSGTSAITSVAKEDVIQLNNDIRYIKTNSIFLIKKGDYFFGSAAFYSGITTPLLAFLSFILLRRRYLSYNSDEVLVKNRKANKMAKKRLLTAEQYIKTNQKEKFYDELFRALYGYSSDKLNIPAADLSKEKIADSLKEKNISNEIIQKLILTLNNCEFARYAPASVSDDLNKIYNDTSDLITQMEEVL